jgi:hypothetical protein
MRFLAFLGFLAGERAMVVHPQRRIKMGEGITSIEMVPPSFRGDAKHRTRNLVIPGLRFAHPGMTRFKLRQRSPFTAQPELHEQRAVEAFGCFGPQTWQERDQN